MVDIIKKSNIKAAVPDMNVADEVADALNNKVIRLLEEASNRAKLNGRKTLLAKDL